MREKIKNTLKITCTDIDLTQISNIEFYVRQGSFFGLYTPSVISQHEMVVIIPFEDAMRLRHNNDVKLQFAFTGADGTPDASDVVNKKVKDLLNEVGYAPV